MNAVKVRRALLGGASVLLALAMPMIGCKPMPFYLEQVLKAYGTVMDASTGEPLESVEVSVAPYQYSELTNGLGDYEIEMATGVWTLSFVKEGYVEFETEPITFTRDEPRVRIDVALEPIVPEPSELVGVWFGANQPFVSNPAFADMRFVFRDNGSYEQLNSIPGTIDLYEGSTRGTYETTDGILELQVSDLIGGYDPVTGEPLTWTPYEADMGSASYVLAGDVLTITLDLSGWGGAADTEWTLHRQPSELVDAWFGEDLPFIDQIPIVDLRLTYGVYGGYQQLVSLPDSEDYLEASSRGCWYTTTGGVLHQRVTHLLSSYDPATGEITWMAYELPEASGSYTVDQDALTIVVDLSGWGGAADTTWTLVRQ